MSIKRPAQTRHLVVLLGALLALLSCSDTEESTADSREGD